MIDVHECEDDQADIGDNSHEFPNFFIVLDVVRRFFYEKVRDLEKDDGLYVLLHYEHKVVPFIEPDRIADKSHQLEDE